MRRRWAASSYLAVQAAAVPAWWAAMARWPAFRRWFELDPDDRAVLDAYLPIDLVVLAGGSAAAAVLVGRGSPAAPAVTAAVAGAWAASTLTLLGWVATRRRGWAGVPPMVTGSAITAAIAGRCDRG